MHIFIIGSGGREHALAWKVLQSPHLTKLTLNSSNASFHSLTESYPGKNIQSINVNDIDIPTLVEYAKKEAVDLAVVGGETPLSLGLSDRLREAGIAVFGPSKSATEIEASKAFSKDFMQRRHIPTARYHVFTDFNAALTHLSDIDYPIVIKASGLASGKGVFLPNSLQEAQSILKNLLIDHHLGFAGEKIIIEERLEGEEVSLLAFTDGTTIKAMPLARDHKRLCDGNTGPNTGGMGAYAPVTLPPEIEINQLIQTILLPTITGLKSENKLFTGVIYAGLMLTPHGPKVLEYNARFGDPETQILLLLLETDLIDIMQACIKGKLSNLEIKWKNQTAACVVLAAKGYPEQKSTESVVISGLDKKSDNTFVFHAGTNYNLTTQQVMTNGGRILAISSIGNTLNETLKNIYDHISLIHFEGCQFRRDIGISEQKNLSKNPDAYRLAGVDITAGNQTVSLITQAVKSTYGKEVLAGIGAFGGMFDAEFCKTMHRPVLVASIDGIGTKVHLGALAKSWQSLGRDIVHHSVNDILVQGARPLFFLDYLAASKLDPHQMAELVTGMAHACREVKCALLGGETAEMPGVYLPHMLDVAGAIVGIVEKDNILPRKNIMNAGDILLGIASSGPHTNGYSLIRKIFEDIPLDTIYPELGISLSNALLAPHRCYLDILSPVLTHSASPIKGLVHITGGGFFENIPRVLPKGLGAQIKLSSWKVPPLFQLIQQKGNVPIDQMYRVFNMGIGMIMIVSPENKFLLEKLIPEPIYELGQLISSQGHQVVLHD